MTNTSFEPRWVSAPGDTILTALQRRLWTVEDLADHLHLPDPVVRKVVVGERPISVELAGQLAQVLGGSIEFWLTREHRYREGLRAIELDDICREMPLDQMVAFGWIGSAGASWRERVEACSAFFGVADAREWKDRYGAAVEQAKYRASAAFESKPAAVAAWLRQAEIQASAIDVAEWNPGLLRQSLHALRSLSKQDDPNTFIPEIQRLLAGSGVAPVVVRAPNGCPISGAVFRTRAGTPALVLSARHLADDHLWFSLFHEIGHLLLHDVQEPVLDDFDTPSLESSELEANEFAQRNLAGEALELLRSGRTGAPGKRAVMAAASRFGIAPGIVVGQLQHAEVLQHNQLNTLKRRYRWDGSTLRSARRP